MYTLEEFLKIKEFLNNYDIFYEEGKSYHNDGTICGYWIKLAPAEIETDELNQEDIEYNESW